MIHKLGTMNDLATLSSLNSKVRKIIENDLIMFDENYGSDRDIDNDYGGYVLYCDYGTKKEELKERFNYTEHQPEFVDLIYGYCHAVYIISDEYAVVVVISKDDAPKEIKDEI